MLLLWIKTILNSEIIPISNNTNNNPSKRPCNTTTNYKNASTNTYIVSSNSSL